MRNKLIQRPTIHYFRCTPMHSQLMLGANHWFSGFVRSTTVTTGPVCIENNGLLDTGLVFFALRATGRQRWRDFQIHISMYVRVRLCTRSFCYKAYKTALVDSDPCLLRIHQELSIRILWIICSHSGRTCGNAGDIRMSANAQDSSVCGYGAHFSRFSRF